MRHTRIGRMVGLGLVALLATTIGGLPLVGVRAANLSATVSLGNPAAGATTSVVFSFTVGTEVPNGGHLVLARPTGYPNFPAANVSSHVSVTVGGTSVNLNSATLSADNLVIKIGNSPFPAAAAVELTVAEGAGITNASTEQNFTWVLTTQNASRNSDLDTYSATGVAVSGSTSTTAAATTTTTTTTTTVAELVATKAIDSDPRSSASKALTDLVNLDLSPNNDDSKLGGSIGLRPGPNDPALELIAIYTRTVQARDGSASSWVKKSSTAAPETGVKVDYTGADYNKPDVWAAEGFGEACWKIDWTTSQYVYPLPTPSVTSGRDLTGWTYTNVIVKAGSVTDPALQVNTIFKAPAVGSGVYADVNRSGTSDPGGRSGDKEISHVVFCGTSNSGATQSTVTGGQASTTTAAPTTTAATTTTAAPTTTTRATSTTTSGGRNTTTTTVPGSKDPILLNLSAEPKVTLCHRTSSRTNPYVSITVDASSVLKEGHGSHTGPLFPADNWGDIIPAFGDYPGLNWPEGKGIVDAGCDTDRIVDTFVRDGKVTLCHATSSRTNPYVTITVDANSVTRRGHDGHTGPVFPADGWGDIIPPFGTYPGLNWPAGQTMLATGCNAELLGLTQVSTTTTGAPATTQTPTTTQSTVAGNVATTTTTASSRSTTTTAPPTTTAAPTTVATTTTVPRTVAPNVASTIPRTTTTLAPTTTITVPEGEWNPSLTSLGKVSSATARRRAQCAESSTFDATLTEVQMLLSRGTSQEVVAFEVCMNTFTVTAANTPLEAFGDAVMPTRAAVQTVPNVGGDLDLLWIAALLMGLGVALLGGVRRYND